LEKVDSKTPRFSKIWGTPVLFLSEEWNGSSTQFLESFLGNFSAGRCPYTSVSLSTATFSVGASKSSSSEVLILDASPIESSPEAAEVVRDSSLSLSRSITLERVIRYVSSSEDSSSEDSSSEDSSSEDSSSEDSSVQDVDSGLQQPVRVSRFVARPPWNTSGYNPELFDLEDLARQGIVHVRQDRHNKEYTYGSGGDWKKLLTIREMLKVVTKNQIYSAVEADPQLGLRWVRAATPWGATPNPQNFRFKDGIVFRRIFRIVSDNFPELNLRNPHPYNQVRAGRQVREGLWRRPRGGSFPVLVVPQQHSRD